MYTDHDDFFHFSSPASPDNTADYDADSVFSLFYSGSSMTLCGAVSAIMNFCTSAKLPYVAIEKLLKLDDLLCPSPNSLPKSVYFLKKFFERFKFEYSQNEYCSECFELTDDCSCTAQNKTSFHIVDVPIQNHLRLLLQVSYICCYYIL